MAHFVTTQIETQVCVVAIVHPDAGGEGVFFYMSGPGSSYMRMSSMSTVGSQPDLALNGTASDFFVYTGTTGNSSVQMPADAVSAAETLDEPGVASDFATAVLALTSSAYSIETRTIVAPAAGYVLAVAFADAQLLHSNGTTSYAQCSIATAGFHVEYPHGLAIGQISTNAPTGTYRIPISANRLVSVPAGSTQFHFVCRSGPTANVAVFARHLDLLYVPTSYGVVTKSVKSAGIVEPEHYAEGSEPIALAARPMTQAERDAERLEAIQFNLDRIQAELAAIQAQAAATEVNANQN